MPALAWGPQDVPLAPSLRGSITYLVERQGARRIRRGELEGV